MFIKYPHGKKLVSQSLSDCCNIFAVRLCDILVNKYGVIVNDNSFSLNSRYNIHRLRSPFVGAAVLVSSVIGS